jgi:HK97 family phage portal protein
MKIIEKIATQLGYTKSVSQADRPPLRASFLRGQPVHSMRKTSDYINEYKSWTYACVNVISQEMGGIDLVLKKRSSQSDFTEVTSHPVLDLLYKVNPLYTSYALWEATAAYLELAGECYWWLLGPKGRPREIWVLRPDWIDVKDTKNKMIDTYSYGPPGDKKLTIPFEEVVPFKDFNPNNPYRGFGTVRGAAQAIVTDKSAADYNEAFFQNSARPGGALEAEGSLSEEQYERLREEWERVHRGKGNSWKVAILEGGLKFKDVGLSQKDMDYLEGRKFSRDEILAIFRVPKAILTFDDVNRAAAREARAILLENLIKPKQIRVAATLTEFLLPRYGDENLFFDIVDPTPADNDYALKKRDIDLKHGVVTRNEVREVDDLPPVEGGDELLVPFGLAPIGSVGEEAVAQSEADKNKKTMVRKQPYPYAKHVEDVLTQKVTEKAEILLRKVAEKHQIKVRAMLEKKTTTEVKSESKDIREQLSRAIIQRTDKREDSMKTALRELFDTQEQKVKGRLETQLSMSRKRSIDDVADVTGDNGLFAAPLSDLIRAFVEAEGIKQIQDLDPNAIFFLQSDAVRRFLEKDSLKFIASINETTSDALREELAEGVDLGESIPQIRSRVEKVYEDARGYRSALIARTETLRATNFATEEAYKQSEVVEAKEWLTAHDERTCPWCLPLDGKVISLGAAYFEKGDEVSGTNDNGKTVRLPINLADVSAPPLHPQCRCTLIPVLKPISELNAPKPKRKKEEAVDISVSLLEMLDERKERKSLVKSMTNELEKAKSEATKKTLLSQIDKENKKLEKLAKAIREERRKALYE